MRIAAVILAAGASRRLGRPKQTVAFGGETLLERAIRVGREAALEPVLVVVADGTLRAAVEGSGARVVLNSEASEGIASSIRCGVRAAEGVGARGLVLMTCDQVLLTPDHLRELCAEPEQLRASGYAGIAGTPAYFPAASFPDLRQLAGDTGARALLRDARRVMREELSVDIDTEEDLARARSLREDRGEPA